MEDKKTYEELNILLPFSLDVNVQQVQWEKMAMIGFLTALPFEYDYVKAYTLSNPEISTFQEKFNRILHTKISSPTLPSAQMRSALVSWNNCESEKQKYRNSGLSGNSKGIIFGGVVCYYYHKARHVIRDCKKW